MIDDSSGKSKRFGFVCFEDPEAAETVGLSHTQNITRDIEYLLELLHFNLELVKYIKYRYSNF